MNERMKESLAHAYDSKKKAYNKQYYEQHKDYWKEYYRKGATKGLKPDVQIGRAAYDRSIKKDVANEYYKLAAKQLNYADYETDPERKRRRLQEAAEYDRLGRRKDDEAYRIYGEMQRLRDESLLRSSGQRYASASNVQVKKTDLAKTKISNAAKQFVKDFKSGAKSAATVGKDAVDKGKSIVKNLLSKFR